MHKTENKSLWRDKMSYGSDIFYIGRIYEELKNYACLEFVCTNLHKSKIAAKIWKYVDFFLWIEHHEITFVDCIK